MFANPAHHASFQQPLSNPHHPDPFRTLCEALSSLTLAPTLTSSPSTAHTPHSITDSSAPDGSHNNSKNNIIPAFPPFASSDNFTLRSSSFFKHHPHLLELPSPATIRTQVASLTAQGYSSLLHGTTSRLVPLPTLDLLVKYGPDVSLTEAKCLILLRESLAETVPVPEVFGWRTDPSSNEQFIYMSLPEGQTLEERWRWMADEEKTAVCDELGGMVRRLKGLRRGGEEGVGGMVGSVDAAPLQDRVFAPLRENGMGLPPPGPFPDVASFHSYFVATAAAVAETRAGVVGDGGVKYNPHHLFPDRVPVVFTHGALHPRNVVVSNGSNPRVVAVIEWGQAGWYPGYWELCKARWEVKTYKGGEDDWGARYLSEVLGADNFENEYQGWSGKALCQYWEYFVSLMHR